MNSSKHTLAEKNIPSLLYVAPKNHYWKLQRTDISSDIEQAWVFLVFTVRSIFWETDISESKRKFQFPHY